MALTLPKLKLPTLSLNKKQLPMIAGGVIVVAGAAYFGWQYFMAEPAPPPRPQLAKPKPVPHKAPSPAEVAKAHDKLVEDLLVASGLKQELNELPQRFIAGLKQPAKPHNKPAAAMAKAVEEALTQTFTAEGFQDRLASDLNKNFDQKRVQALLKDLSGPTGKALVALQHTASSPQELQQFARSAAAKPSAQRAALLKRIDSATRASELAVDSAFVSMKSLGVGIAGQDERKVAALEKSMEKGRAATTKAIQDATLLNLEYSFKDTSDADLEKYAKFYETAEARWFYAMAYASLLEEVKSASAAAGKRVHDAMAQPGSPIAKSGKSMARADARSCLSLTTDAAIIKCAEKYR